MIVLVEEDLQKLVLTRDLQSLFELETCLAGGTQLAESLPGARRSRCRPSATESRSFSRAGRCSAPPLPLPERRGDPTGAPGPDRRSGRTARDAAREARKRAAEQGLSAPEQEEAGNAAAQQILSQFQGSLVQTPSSMGSPRFPASTTRSSSAGWCSPRASLGTPKERFGYLFPNKGAAQIIVRLRPDLTDQERHDAIGLWQAAPTRDSDSATAGGRRHRSAGSRRRGSPRAARPGADPARGRRFRDGAHPAALIPPRPSAFCPRRCRGGRGRSPWVWSTPLADRSLSARSRCCRCSSDWRWTTRSSSRRDSTSRGPRAPPGQAVADAAVGGGLVIGAACIATIAGFAVFALAPSPLVRSFGLLLVIGVATAFLVAHGWARGAGVSGVARSRA